MLGRKRDRVAEAELVGFQPARLAAAAFGLVGGDDHRRRIRPRSQRPISSSSGVRPSRASIRNKAASDSRTAASVCARMRPGRLCGVLVLEAGGVHHPEGQVEQLRLALAPVAGDARQVVDQRDAPADQPVEQGRLADIGSADDGDGGQGHGASALPARRMRQPRRAVERPPL